MTRPKLNVRYSKAFKQKVISEIEAGKFTILEACRIYDIGSSASVYVWLRKFGKNHLITKTVRVEMKNETDKLKELERQKVELESALAQSI